MTYVVAPEGKNRPIPRESSLRNGVPCEVVFACFVGQKRTSIWVRFIESITLVSNRENIEIYYINLDVFSIGIEFFAFSR